MAFTPTVAERMVIALASTDTADQAEAEATRAFLLNGSRYQNYPTQAEVLYPKPADIACLGFTWQSILKREETDSPGCDKLIMRGDQFAGANLNLRVEVGITPETLDDYVALVDRLWGKLKGDAYGFFNLYEVWDEVTAHADDRWWYRCKLDQPPTFPMPTRTYLTQEIGEQGYKVIWDIGIKCERAERYLGAAADTTKPTVSTVTPADDATGQLTTVNIVVKFSETMDTDSATDETVLVFEQLSATPEDITQTSVAFAWSTTTVTDDTLTINPDSDFTSGSRVIVVICEGGVRDAAGNTIAATAESDFEIA